MITLGRKKTYNKILARETKIAKDRYGSGYYKLPVKKSTAHKYRQLKKKK